MIARLKIDFRYVMLIAQPIGPVRLWHPNISLFPAYWTREPADRLPLTQIWPLVSFLPWDGMESGGPEKRIGESARPPGRPQMA